MTTLYEHGTLASLMAGNFEGTLSLKELLKHGSIGVGTFNDLDGEGIILDGHVYQAESSGKINEITDLEQKVPFASVHFPEQGEKIELNNTDIKVIEDELPRKFNLRNVFAAVKLHGELSYLHTRIAPKQEKPYPSFLEVSKDQPEFTYENVSGTIIGYYAPAIFDTVTAGGWHLHFLSDDRQIGGHLLDFKSKKLVGNLEVFETFEQHFPIYNQEFRNGKVNLDTLRQDIASSEKA
ncbi:acetolactate decarboxylase [Lactobacillus sp. PV037]|uniref:acetolactate decarboxylase n=1 Tax=Lactobacillus sp. PV037 TaxID=2594496 RepID=UPI00223F7D2C|nr:acetolactate decarboxylase [Lactobacillus sp. PV037]QNQ83685.1 acetolactate decarboxylase [Lactobacillus sp. PV037]